MIEKSFPLVSTAISIQSRSLGKQLYISYGLRHRAAFIQKPCLGIISWYYNPVVVKCNKFEFTPVVKETLLPISEKEESLVNKLERADRSACSWKNGDE